MLGICTDYKQHKSFLRLNSPL